MLLGEPQRPYGWLMKNREMGGVFRKIPLLTEQIEKSKEVFAYKKQVFNIH